jgi:hypothetical protein
MKHEDNLEEVWFPEPKKRDDSYGPRGESPPSWLARSTRSEAKIYRAFLNRNLAALPRECQENVSRDLRLDRKHRSAFFELVVARMLQELGASITCEPENEVDGTKIDVWALFLDHAVAVEATSPVFNKDTASTARDRNRLTDFVEECEPAGWRVAVVGLPDIGPAGSMKRFKAEVKRMLDVPPPAEGEEKRILSRKLPEGEIRLNLLAQTVFGRKDGMKKVVHEAPLSIVGDDSEQVIRDAVKDKYRQAKNMEVPVLVAVDGKGLLTRLEDFDMALFGHYRLHPDNSTSFKVDGIFARKGQEPTIAGVLAFTEVGVSRCIEPVLYIHPRFSGELPAALRQLEQRRLVPNRSGLEVPKSSNRGFLRL